VSVADAASPAATSRPVRAAWIIVTAVGVLLVTSPLLGEVADIRQAVLAEAILLVCTAGLVGAVANGARIVQAIFWAFCGTWLGLSPMYQLAVNRVAWSDMFVLTQDDEVVTAQLLLLLALFAFLIGSHLPARTNTVSCSTIDYCRLRRGAAVLLVFTLLLLPAVISLSGGIGGLFTSRSQRADALRDAGVLAESGGRGIFVLLPAAAATVGTFMALRALRNEAVRVRFLQWRVGSLLLALVGIFLLVLVANPLANTRFISLSALGCCLLAVLRPTTRWQGATLGLIAIISLSFLYPIADVFRNRVETSAVREFSLADWTTGDFDALQQWANTVMYVQDHGHTGGRFTLSAALFFVPRSLWTSKQIPASIPIAEYRNYHFTNLSLPFPAELYLEFGVMGMAVVMLMMGWLWQCLDRAWLTRPDSLLSAIAPLVATQQLGFLRGPMGSQIPSIGAVLLLATAVLYWARLRHPEPRTLPYRRSS
jgi:hypothetical protein